VPVIDIAGLENELEGYAQTDDDLAIFIANSSEEDIAVAAAGERPLRDGWQTKRERICGAITDHARRAEYQCIARRTISPERNRGDSRLAWNGLVGRCCR